MNYRHTLKGLAVLGLALWALTAFTASDSPIISLIVDSEGGE